MQSALQLPQVMLQWSGQRRDQRTRPLQVSGRVLTYDSIVDQSARRIPIFSVSQSRRFANDPPQLSCDAIEHGTLSFTRFE